MAMPAPVVIVCLKPLANPDAAWPSLLDFGVILWSFCIIILVILYYHSGHSVLSIQALYVEGRFARAVPLVIFGGLGVLAGLLALSLPETLHRNLPDTIKDTVNLCEWVQSSIHPLFSFSRQRINTQRS